MCPRRGPFRGRGLASSLLVLVLGLVVVLAPLGRPPVQVPAGLLAAVEHVSPPRRLGFRADRQHEPVRRRAALVTAGPVNPPGLLQQRQPLVELRAGLRVVLNDRGHRRPPRGVLQRPPSGRHPRRQRVADQMGLGRQPRAGQSPLPPPHRRGVLRAGRRACKVRLTVRVPCIGLRSRYTHDALSAPHPRRPSHVGAALFLGDGP